MDTPNDPADSFVVAHPPWHPLAKYWTRSETSAPAGGKVVVVVAGTLDVVVLETVV